MLANIVCYSRVCHLQNVQITRYRAQQGREPSILHHMQQLRISTIRHRHQNWFHSTSRQEKKDAWLRRPCSGSAARRLYTRFFSLWKLSGVPTEWLSQFIASLGMARLIEQVNGIDRQGQLLFGSSKRMKEEREGVLRRVMFVCKYGYTIASRIHLFEASYLHPGFKSLETLSELQCPQANMVNDIRCPK